MADEDDGISSGLALFYIFWVVLSSYILTLAPYLQLITAQLYDYFLQNQLNNDEKNNNNNSNHYNYVGKFLWLSEFCYSIGSIASLVIISVLTSQAQSAVIAVNVFLIGITFYFVSLSFFALYHSEWQNFQIFIIAKYLAFLSFSLFLFFQLIFPGIQTSYRYNGVLWIGLSSIILLYLSSVMSKSNSNDKSVIPELFLIQPCKSALFRSSIEQLEKSLPTTILSIQTSSESQMIKKISLWILSLIPYFFFCLTMTVSVPFGQISYLVFGISILIEAITGYLLTNTYFDYNLETICWIICAFRFLLVLSGPHYWLFGCCFVLLVMSIVISLTILHKLFPLSEKKHSAFDMIMNAIKAKSKTSSSSSSSSHVNNINNGGSEPLETSQTIERLNHLYATSPLSIDLFCLFMLQIGFLIVFIIDGIASSNLSPRIENYKQSTWGCLIWFSWIVFLFLYMTYYGIQNGGFSSRSYQQYKVVNFLRSFYGQVRVNAVDDVMLPEIPLKGILPILCGLSWILLIGWFTFLAKLIDRWVIIPCAAFLPLAIIFYLLRLHQWIKTGCYIPTNFNELMESLRVHLLLQPPSNLENPYTKIGTLYYRLYSSWFFCYFLLWMPVIICSNIIYFYPVLYLVLWLMSCSFTIISIFRWRIKLQIDFIFHLLLCLQWLPLIIWAILTARQTDAFQHSLLWIVTVLALAAISLEMLILNIVMWRDISNPSIDITQLPGAHNYKMILKYMIILSFCITTCSLTILSSTISPAFGIFSLFLIISFFLFILSYYRIYSISKYRKEISVLIGILLLSSGIYGIIFRYDEIFWWISASWLCLAFVFLLSGIRNDLSSVNKVYGVYYFPVLIQSPSGDLIDCSLTASGILISLIMICLWALWLRVIEGSDIGGILYVLCLVVVYSYIRHKSSLSSLKSQFLQLNLELLSVSLEYALKRIDLLPPNQLTLTQMEHLVTQLIEQRNTQFHELEVTLQDHFHLIPFIHLITLLFHVFSIPKEIHILLQDFTCKYNKTIRLIEQVDQFYGYFRLQLTKEMTAFHTIQRENIVSFLRSCDGDMFLELQGHPEELISFSELLPEDLLKLPTDKLILLLKEFHNHEKQRIKENNLYMTVEEQETNRLSMRMSLMRKNELENNKAQEKLLEAQVLENQHKLKQAEEELETAKKLLVIFQGEGDSDEDEDEDGNDNDNGNDGDSKEDEKEDGFYSLSKSSFQLNSLEEGGRGSSGGGGGGVQSMSKMTIKQVIKDSKNVIKNISNENAKILSQQRSSRLLVGNNQIENELVGSYGKPLNVSLDELFQEVSQTQSFVDNKFTAAEMLCGYPKLDLQLKRASAIDPFLVKQINSKGFPLDHTPNPLDVSQGDLGDCYLLSALSAIAENKSLRENLLLEARPEYSLYVVRFFISGKPVLVPIDDNFPHTGEDFAFAGKSCVESPLSHNLWFMLIEKAYAKLHGSYVNIDGGRIAEALADLTGGLPGRIESLATNSEEKWEIVKAMGNPNYILGATSAEGSDTTTDEFGIVRGHAYSILRVVEIDSFKLLCLRNPWGKGEWNGRWSDNSIEWTPRYRRLLNHHGSSDDGLFWISFEDFCKHYRTIDYCKLVNLPGWKSHLLVGSWLPHKGGRMGLSESFPSNPQFYLSSSSSNCHVSLVLSQHEIKDDESLLCNVDYKCIYIFRISDLINANHIAVTSSPTRLPKMITTPRQKLIYKKFDSFQNSRDILLEFQLEKGVSVLIIPCTYDPVRETSPFTLKIFTNGDCEFKTCEG